MTCRSEIIKAINVLSSKTNRDTFALKEIVRQVLAQTAEYVESTIRTHITSWMCVNTTTGHGGMYPDLFKAGRGLYRLNRK